jgi:adenylosuccinate synthase
MTLDIDWPRYNTLVEKLALEVHRSGFRFNQIICIARGGLRVGDVLSRIFDQPLAICEPVYEEFPGWSESTVGVKAFDKLPANAQAYLKRLEQLVGAPVAIISTGPDREETIVLRHPFE